MSETKKFPLRVLLSCTTHRLLTKSPKPGDNGIGDLYKILGWMTNDSPFTHQLPRFNSECEPWLRRWFPELSQVDALLPSLDKLLDQHGNEAGVESWLASLPNAIPSLRSEYDVPRIPRDDHDFKNPIDELAEIRGTDSGIIVVELKE